MNIVKGSTPQQFTKYVLTATAGELIALWVPMEQKRLQEGLSAVEYDCWLQLNRTMEGIAPEMVKEHK